MPQTIPTPETLKALSTDDLRQLWSEIEVGTNRPGGRRHARSFLRASDETRFLIRSLIHELLRRVEQQEH